MQGEFRLLTFANQPHIINKVKPKGIIQLLFYDLFLNTHRSDGSAIVTIVDIARATIA